MAKSESFDTLKDLPRVPHAEGTIMTGRQVGVGGNPPDKKYRSYGEAVDNAVAVARLNARRKGEMEKIPGGLDDEDPRLYMKPQASSLFSKMKVAQSKALTDEDVQRLKTEEKPVQQELPAPVGKPVQQTELRNTPQLGPSMRLARAELEAELAAESMGGPVGKPAPAPEGRLDPSLPRYLALVSSRIPNDETVSDMGGPAGTVPPVEPQLGSPQPQHHAQPQTQPQVVYVEKPAQVVEKVVEVEKETEASKWLKRRFRVEIATDQMSFNISAIAVIRSIHAVTVILPTANDAMTFVPNVGANVKVHPAGGDVLDTIFTGASFDIPELGIMGLAFLIPNG